MLVHNVLHCLSLSASDDYVFCLSLLVRANAWLLSKQKEAETARMVDAF